jgi:hypothetical protein
MKLLAVISAGREAKLVKSRLATDFIVSWLDLPLLSSGLQSFPWALV